MFTIIYEPLNEAALLCAVGHKADQPSRAVQALSFWLGAQADDGLKGPFSIRTGKPRAPKTPDPMAAPFKLVVGGVYRCRDGSLAYIIRRNIETLGDETFVGSRINPLTGECIGPFRWLKNGRREPFQNSAFHPTNICAPYVQPQES